MSAAWTMVLLAAFGANAEIVDRLAVRLDKHVITDSDIRAEIRLVSLIEGDQPDFSPANRRRTAERLVDQWLIGREMQVVRRPAAEPPIQGKLFARLLNDRFGGDEKRYRAALARYGVRDEEVRAHLRRQFSYVRFLSIRFRPGVQVSDQEVEDYFDKEVAPKLRAEAEKSGRNPQGVSIEEFRDEIERKLIEQRVDQQAEEWLKSVRERTFIHFEPGAFQ